MTWEPNYLPKLNDKDKKWQKLILWFYKKIWTILVLEYLDSVRPIKEIKTMFEPSFACKEFWF